LIAGELLLLRHHFAPVELDVSFWQDELRTPDLVLCRTRFVGGMFDEVRNLPGGQRELWSKARIVLAGHLLTQTPRGGVILGPGDLVVSRGWDDHHCRALEYESEYLLVAWRNGSAAGDPPREGGPFFLRGLDARHGPAAAARALTGAIDAGAPRQAILDATGAVLAALASFGLPVAREGAKRAVEPGHHRFARALEATVFPLTARPMTVDLCRALGLGERQTTRLANDFFARFFVTAPGWRGYVRGMRLEIGVVLASNPRATTERVSRALGFASPTALCHAFQSAGMPSPQEVRRQLAL
jgi:AraC-like DNA-binding protein